MIEKTKDLKDCEEAFEVSFNAFNVDGASSELKTVWHNKWFKDPSFSNDCILIHRDAGKIVAGLRTVERTIYRLNQEYKMLGIGEIFVKPGYQGKGLTGKLVNGVIELARQGSYDILVGIARKNIDGFYLRYGLWGVGSYSQLTIKGFSRDVKVGDMALKQVELSELSQINDIYNSSYAKSFGAMNRSSKHWEFLLNSMKNSKRAFFSIAKGNILVGYVVCDSHSIMEVGLLKDCNYIDLLHFLKGELFKNEDHLIVSVPPSHPILENDLGLDISCRLRECYYGGHILKIINKSSVISKFFEREQQWYKSNHIDSYKYNRADLEVDWNYRGILIKGQKQDLGLDPSADEYDPLTDIEYSSRAIPEDVPYDQTLLLCGIQSQYRCNSQPALSSPYLPFFIPPIDEF